MSQITSSTADANNAAQLNQTSQKPTTDPVLGIATPSPDDDDPRMNKIIKSVPLGVVPRIPPDVTGHHYIALIGFPSDEGTLRNGGVGGGFQGPAQFRRYMMKKGTIFNDEYKHDISRMRIVDFGDVVTPYSGDEHRAQSKQEACDSKATLAVAHTYEALLEPTKLDDTGYRLEEAHRRLEGYVTRALNLGYTPFCIGGSNDQSYPNACGAINYLRGLQGETQIETYPLSVINIDAHLDVRPLIDSDPHDAIAPGGRAHSGSPFRQLLETPGIKGENFVEFAAQGAQCSTKHANYVISKGGQIHWLEQLRETERTTGKRIVDQFRDVLNSFPSENFIFVSFDIDSVKASDAPGVSCPAPVGLEASEAIEMAYVAGACSKVLLFDLSELCPAVEKDRTPLLAAFMFYAFVRGRSTLLK